MQLSNYFVLLDSNLELNENQVKRFSVEMPDAPAFVGATARPVLWFNMNPLTSSRLKINVILNHLQGDTNYPANKVVWSYDNPDDIRLLRSTHEVLDGNAFLDGQTNQIDFRVIVGKVRISDVLLFYRLQT